MPRRACTVYYLFPAFLLHYLHRVLAVRAYYTPFYSLFIATSNPSSLFETVLTTSQLALSSIFARASSLRTPFHTISGVSLSRSDIFAVTVHRNF
jgi:hypothetical protein